MRSVRWVQLLFSARERTIGAHGSHARAVVCRLPLAWVGMVPEAVEIMASHRAKRCGTCGAKWRGCARDCDSVAGLPEERRGVSTITDACPVTLTPTPRDCKLK